MKKLLLCVTCFVVCCSLSACGADVDIGKDALENRLIYGPDFDHNADNSAYTINGDIFTNRQDITADTQSDRWDMFKFSLQPGEQAAYRKSVVFTETSDFEYQVTWVRSELSIQIGLIDENGNEYLKEEVGGSAHDVIVDIPAGTYQFVVRSCPDNSKSLSENTLVVGAAALLGETNIDSDFPTGSVSFMPNQQNNKESGPLNEDSISGEFFSVNRGDESKFTPEEWKEILQEVEDGKILLFDTLEDELAYIEQIKIFSNGHSLESN